MLLHRRADWQRITTTSASNVGEEILRGRFGLKVFHVLCILHVLNFSFINIILVSDLKQAGRRRKSGETKMNDGTKDNDTLWNNLLVLYIFNQTHVYKLGIVCRRIKSIFAALVHGQGGRLRVY